MYYCPPLVVFLVEVGETVGSRDTRLDNFGIGPDILVLEVVFALCGTEIFVPWLWLVFSLVITAEIAGWPAHDMSVTSDDFFSDGPYI